MTSSSDLFRLLLDTRTWVALDIDVDGRVLAGHDDLGSQQLVEIASDGVRTPLTDLPSKCRGRYVPGCRQVVVEHDQGVTRTSSSPYWISPRRPRGRSDWTV